MAEPQHGYDNGRRNRDESDELNPSNDDRSWRAPGQGGYGQGSHQGGSQSSATGKTTTTGTP